MKIFGLRSSYIGSLKIKKKQCSYCETNVQQNIIEYGRYFHVFLIPIFPMGRRTFGECDYCKKTSKKSEFDFELKKIYYENELKLRRPWWHWFGLIFIILVVVFFILTNLF
ncbi:zinc-ribbon domain-containing protein [Flagellimonas sp. CMM7]|uniref:zinc-ribbon domain-containing protein n=1 Tax=Flagellimonas sp. CMM7 TaxID=2654676 RepID=UPI0013D3270C